VTQEDVSRQFKVMSACGTPTVTRGLTKRWATEAFEWINVASAAPVDQGGDLPCQGEGAQAHDQEASFSDKSSPDASEAAAEGSEEAPGEGEEETWMEGRGGAAAAQKEGDHISYDYVSQTPMGRYIYVCVCWSESLYY
jgi:hypothetical protein